ncbi:MAG: YiiX/YebB-like N1pC/P60 family cysteine hydrolase [Betaproteobacteria bacterium]
MRRLPLSAALFVLFGHGLPAAASESDLDLEIPLATRVAQCQQHQMEVHGGATVEDRAAAMERELFASQRLFEEALAMRAGAIDLYRELDAKIARNEPLNGQDLQRLQGGAAQLLAQREALLKLAFAHECWLAAPPEDNTREAGVQATGIMISLASALILYDNYLSAITLFVNNHALRQQLNSADKGFALPAGQLNETSRMFASSLNRQRVRRAIHWFEQYGRRLTPEFENYPYLLQLVEQSPSYRMVRAPNPVGALGKHFELFSMQTIDSLIGLKNEGSNLTSLLFGNTVGLVETRRGKLYGRAEVAQKVGQGLKAGDILLEKTPFRLTDTFIPGHWGHAAIWVGNEAELRELGIWDHPVVQPYQANIRSGKGIVEALRSGVVMNNVQHFLNIDDLAVLRHEVLPADKRAEIILQTLRQVGKAYDFNFDAETTKRIFCSKLVYLAYGDLNWPTSSVLGRATVSPDNIGARALGEGPLAIALLYHDGQEVTDGRKDLMEKLMQPRRKVQLAGSD